MKSIFVDIRYFSAFTINKELYLELNKIENVCQHSALYRTHKSYGNVVLFLLKVRNSSGWPTAICCC